MTTDLQLEPKHLGFMVMRVSADESFLGVETVDVFFSVKENAPEDHLEISDNIRRGNLQFLPSYFDVEECENTFSIPASERTINQVRVDLIALGLTEVSEESDDEDDEDDDEYDIPIPTDYLSIILTPCEAEEPYGDPVLDADNNPAGTEIFFVISPDAPVKYQKFSDNLAKCHIKHFAPDYIESEMYENTFFVADTTRTIDQIRSDFEALNIFETFH